MLSFIFFEDIYSECHVMEILNLQDMHKRDKLLEKRWGAIDEF